MKYDETAIRHYLGNSFSNALSYDITDGKVTVWFQGGGSTTLPRTDVERAMDRRLSLRK